MILEEIVQRRRIDIARRREAVPFNQVRDIALAQAGARTKATEQGGEPPVLLPDRACSFEAALAPCPGKRSPAFICEVKKASPSKGIIARDFPYLSIAREYAAAGAAALSVLTEPEYFQGIADSLGLASLVEVHTQDELQSALEAGARIVGINNRDLGTFQVDLGIAGRLRKLIPPGILTVSESGIQSREHIRVLEDAGIDAVLIGETLMRATDKKSALAALRGETS
jgi:indole-3-glycerol phosphate synthase